MERIRDARWPLLLLLALLLVGTTSGGVFSPQDVPGPPERVLVTPRGDAALRVQFLPPVRTKAEGNNGAPVLGYKVEVAQRVDDVQTFTVEANGPVSAGAYRMTFTNARGTETTACVPWNASEILFETALEELLIVDSVSVTRSAYGAARFGYVYTVVFDGKHLVSGSQPNVLVGDQVGCAATKPLNRVLTLTGAHVTTGVQGYQPEVWEIVTDESTGDGLVGGAFDVSVGFDGDWQDSTITATIAAGSRTAITSTSMIGKVNRGDAVKIGGEEFTVHLTAPFTDTQLPLDSYHIRGTTTTAVYLQDTALGDVAVTLNSATVTTSSDFRALIAPGEHVKIGSWQFKVLAMTASTMTLDKIAPAGRDKWPDASTQHITAYKRKKVTIDANDDAVDVQKALDALPGVGVVEVARVGPTKQNGYRWLVTFESLGSSNKCPEAPCLMAEKVTGSAVRLTDPYGGVCATCVVSASLLKDESNNALSGFDGEYLSTSVIATKEIGGTIDEVQTISVVATADDVRGTFAVNFQNTFAQTAGATINYYDTAADLRTKLQNLPTVGRLNVSRSENAQFGYTWTITFLTNMGDQPLFVVDKSGLTGTGVDVIVEEREKGVDTPFEAIVEGLSPSRDYYVRAFARNENGYGTGTDLIQSSGKGAQPLTTQIATSPAVSKITATWPISGTELGIHFTTPDARGSPIEKYLVEYAIDSTFGVAPVKRVFIYNPLEYDMVGTFRIQYGDFLTPLLPIHTTADAMADALGQIPSLRPVRVARAPFVLTGTVTSRVKSFVAAKNTLITTSLTERQCRLLAPGVTIRVGQPNVVNSDSFIVKTQPIKGSTVIEVESGHGVLDFTNDRYVLKIDEQGTQMGPSGYEWTISFVNEVETISHGAYPGLQIVSALASVESGSLIASYGMIDVQVAAPTAFHGLIELSNNPVLCDSYVVGAPSADQVLQLFASTTVTQGSFKLQLGSASTACITLGTRASKSNLRGALKALPFVADAAVEEQRMFKVSVLTGSSASKVSAYSAAQAKITVTALTADQAAALPVGAIVQVSRNPNDFSRHSCEFTVTTAPAAADTLVSVTAVGTCADFSGESRSLKILDFHDYKIRLYGQYPTGEWPTLKVLSSAFGDGTVCAAWSPTVPVYSKVHTVKYEGSCANGQRGSQTIMADALNEIGGFFTLSYRGKETVALPFQTTTASTMRDAIDSITRPGNVNVTLSKYGSYGKAWRVTFMSDEDGEDLVFIKHSFLTGQDASISVYPTIEISSDAQRDDISGTFRLTFGGQLTEPIAYTATHAKVIQELQKLSVVDSVVALGGTGDVGVTSLKLTATATNGNPVLTDIKLNGKTIDPMLYIAVRESLTIDNPVPYGVKSITPVDITLATNFGGATGTVTILAGAITKQTKPLPGRVSISRLMPIVTAVKASTTFELPSDHGYRVNDVFYVKGSKFTVATVAAAVITTVETYNGDDITNGSPQVFLFDNRLRTTSDLSRLLNVNDEIWLPNAAGDMDKYIVADTVQPRYIPVTGVFTDSIVAGKALSVGYGRKWTLVFRSYTAELDTIDALPQNDWRGTEVRLRARHPNAISPQTTVIGNADEWQTVLLEAPTAADVGNSATYTLTFGDETTQDIPWAATGDDVQAKLQELSNVQGVTVTSMPHDNGFVHTIRFWGEYTMPKLPTLKGAVTAAVNANKCSILVRDKGAVAHTKRDHVILKSSQDLRLRVFAVNDKGISDAPDLFSLQTATTSVVPTPPTSVVLGEYHGTTWLSINYRPPVYTGGAEITMYRLEWDSSPTFDSASSNYGVANIQKRFEVQRVTTSYRSNVNSGGTFTLAWGGRVTTPLAFDCSADQMTDALAVITDTTNIAVNPVKVIRARASWGYTWTITFLNTPGNLALLVADGSLLTGDFPLIGVTELVQGFSDLAIGDFTHEVQDVYTDASTVLSGTFKLEFLGKITGDISVDASALEMQDALQALTTLYSIKVTRTWRTQAMNSAIWSVTFAYLKGEEMVGAGDIFLMTVADVSSLVGTAASVRVANKIVGSDPFRYTITGLRPGTRYYMHAMAYNAQGFGSATSPMSSAVTCGQPDPPKSVVASVVDGKTLAVSWTASEFDGGCGIDKYKVEWYRAEGVREEQTITTSANKGLPEIQRVVDFADSDSLGGFFKLAFGNEVTENIAWDAPAVGLNSIKSRLERLSSVGTVDVSRQQSRRVVTGLIVTCAGTTLTIDPSSTTTIAASGLRVNDLIWVLGTQLTIGVVGATTLTVTPALTASVAVPVFSTAFGYEWRITFQAGHVGPQELLRVSTSDSWAGNNPGIYVESVQRGLQPISGTFRVSFASGGLSHITQPLPHNVTAEGMKDALENLVTIGLVNVTRSPNGFGFNWLVTFVSDVKNELSLLGVDSTELHGPSVRISAAITNEGVQPDFYCETNGVAGAAAVLELPAPNRYVVGGLLTGQKYAIRVRAHNSEGYGGGAYISPSYQIPRTTPSAPAAVKLLVMSSRQLKVRWDAPASDGGSMITSYIIQWDTSNAFTNVDSPSYDMKAEMRVLPTDTSPFFYNIALTAAGTYFARVIAVNDQGPGIPAATDPVSAVPVDRTPGQPENVRATVLSSYAILVEWDPSSSQKPFYGGDGGLPITQYMIEWDSSSAFDSPASFGLVDQSKRSFIIGGNDPVTGVRSNILIPNTMYSMRVTAFNAKGAGTPRATTPASVIAANQVPTVPRNLQLSVIPATSIKAEWENPLYDGGLSLKSYEVEWDEMNDFSSGQSSHATIPIVREMQSITVSTEVVNEEQFVDATVEVINEVQVVRTLFTGADEIQVIETTNDNVVDEVQTVTTSATDRDEVQELRVDADDVNEIQAVRTTVPETFEVQTIKVGATRNSEVQSITFTIPGTNPTLIGGDLSLTFDNTICTHCTKTATGMRRASGLISSLKTASDTDGAQIIQDALNGLANIDGVVVSRSTGGTTTLIYTYLITFSGDKVAGNVPELVVERSITYNSLSVGGLPTIATEVTPGAEVKLDPASVFRVTHTCESYSDPNMITTFSSDCAPPDTARLCATCVTDFDGTTFTIAAGTTLAGTVAAGNRLIAGICVFEVGSNPTATSIAVLADDVGTLCSTFQSKALPLYRATQRTVSIPVKTDATTLSAPSVVDTQLNSMPTIDFVVVSGTGVVASDFVGSEYVVTFRKRSGMIPTMLCDRSAILVTSGNSVCTVTRTTKGSMIYGSFTLKLTKESDSTFIDTTPAIPWDASEALLKSILEARADNGELIYGTVTVRRSVYSATANKWSGGFTWQIEFTSRGWDIPKITAVSSLSNSASALPADAPTVTVEDADTPMTPFAGSRHGNIVAGTITLSYGGITAIPFTVGTDTDMTQLHTSVVDTTLQTFITTKLGAVIPSISITRSAATQARGFTWTITFVDKETGGDVPMLQLPVTQLTGQNVRARMFETVKGNELGGTFQLQFNNEKTGPILFSADKLAVQAQLNSLASIKPSSVLVDRVGPFKTAATQVLSYTWYITFRSSQWADPTSDHANGIIGNWKGVRAKWDDVWPETSYSKAWGRHVGPMGAKGFMVTCIKDGLTTTASDNSQDCTTAVDTAGVGPIKGTFKLTLDTTNADFMSVKDVVTSGPIAHNAWATKEDSGATGTSVEEILESMANIGDVAVSRSSVNTRTGGYSWTITFLRDANGPCEQREPSTNGVVLCNAPGDVPAFTKDATGLSGSTPAVAVCEKTAGNCFTNVVQNGLLLRGDFTTFKVTNDPGFSDRYWLKTSCPNSVAPNCGSIDTFTVAVGSEEIPIHLLVGDRFTVGTYSTCVFTATEVTAAQVKVTPLVCTGMPDSVAGVAMGVSIRVPWNADESLVKRTLEASSELGLETGIWTGGRKVNVVRTIHGKYGEVSWQVRFISNPTFTPPGAGNIPDITTVFLPSPTVTYQTTVTQVTPGSVGLGGSFLIDFRSTIGPRRISFDESEERLQRKLNEMNTIGRVMVKKLKYPSRDTGCLDSICSGGWDDMPVDNAGTRGGYRWRVRFMKVTGEYSGLTFPSGSGNVNPLSVTLGTLTGSERSIDVTTNMPGSRPILGGFQLNTTSKATPLLPYSSSADSIKQGIESMNLFGEVDVTQDFLVTQRVPNAVATLSKDAFTATIAGVDDIRQYFAPGDYVRFGPTAASNLVGTNGDSPFSGVLATSMVSVEALSPIVRANAVARQRLYPGMTVRIDGLTYSVKRSGAEIQTLTTAIPAASANPLVAYFKLSLRHRGSSQTSAACLKYNEDFSAIEADLLAQLQAINAAAVAGDIKVTRRGPVSSTSGNVAQKGYVYSIYFLGDSVAGDVSTLLVSTTGCTALAGATSTVAVVTHGGTIPRQRISLATDSGQVIDASGYFKLTLGAATTGCLTWGITASDLETQLETTLSTGDVLVSRRGSGNSITEIQRLRLTSNSQVTSPATGLFQLALTLDGKTSWTSTCLAYGVSAEDMQVAINQLDNVGAGGAPHINVTRDGDGSSSWGYGYEYTFTFRGPITGGYSAVLGNVNQLEAINVGTGPCAPVVGGDPALILETVRDGSAGFSYDIFFLASPLGSTTAFMAPLTMATAACAANAWTHNGGSVRKASLEVVDIGGSAEVQTLTIQGSAAITPTASYKLSFGGVSTNCIEFQADVSVLETELTSLTTIGASGVFVSRDQHPIRAPNGYISKITFVGELTTGDVPMLGLVLNDVACAAFAGTTQLVVAEERAGGFAPGAFVTTALYDGERPGQQHVAYSVGQIFRVMNEQIEVQTITIKNAQNDIAGGATYQLVVKGVTTDPIAWDISEADMETRLAVAASGDGEIVVTRRLDAAAAPHGYVYTVYFSGDSVAGSIDPMTVAAASMTNFNGGSIDIKTTAEGVDNVAPFKFNSIPLALASDASTAVSFLPSGDSLDVYKVNGFLWTIKFKSTIGNVPALGAQTSTLTGKLTIVDDFIAGSASNSYVMTDLMPGIPYFVRVAASTDAGIGAFTSTASKTPSGVATPVQNVAAGYALYAREVQEVRTAATHITEIQEIATSAAKMAEVQTLRTFAAADSCFDGKCIKGRIAFRVPTIQTITVSALGPITVGSFSIRFVRKVSNGDGTFKAFGTVLDTAPIAWNAEAEDVKNAMAALDAVDASDIVVTRDGDKSAAFGYGYIYSITFVGNNVAGETELITIADKSNTCTLCTAFATTGNVAYSISVAINAGEAMGTDTAVQEVIVKAAKPLFAGSYRLVFNYLGASVQSACINFDAAARGSGDLRAMETILSQMSNIDKVYVTRSLDAVRAPNGFVYRLFFYGNGVSGDIPQMTSVQTQCADFQTQENNALTRTGVNGQVVVSTLDPGGFAVGNMFGDADKATSAQLEADLDRLPVFGDVIATRSLVDQQGGFVWTVAFKDSEGNLPQFICAVDTTFATTVGTDCEATTLTDGNVLSGSFVVDSSVPIPFDASAATLKSALEAMAWVGTVQVVRSAPTPQMGFKWTITFLDYMGDVPDLTVTSSLVGTASSITVTEIRKGNSIGGTFTLQYLSSKTEPIAWNARATRTDSGGDGSSLQEKLEALSIIGPLRVTRSSVDQEGGYTWLITFLDNNLNPGDLPLLQGNASMLTGVGVVAATREILKGSNAVGDQLWLSFDPPVSDNGSPITKYLVRWDTAATFTASPGEFGITEPEKLYLVQRIETSAASLAWSSIKPALVNEVQTVTIVNNAAANAVFTLSFRGVQSAQLTVGVSTAADLLAALSALSSIGTVTVSPATGVLSAASQFAVTFTSKPGNLPILQTSDATVATVAETTAGVTNYRKEVVVFKCTGNAGQVKFTYGTEFQNVDFDATLAITTAKLHTLFGVDTGSIRVLSTQALLCAPAGPADITIVFDRVYGNIVLDIQPSVVGGPTIVVNPDASIDGVYNNAVAKMSGTFQVGYAGEYTRSLNAESTAVDVRYALEDLSTIQTVGVDREPSYQVLAGKLDVENGRIFATCAAGEVCDFKRGSHGLPGQLIRLGGSWYTIMSGTVSQDDLESARLFLGDLNGREIGYMGATRTAVTAFEWTKGYIWSVYMLSVDQPLTYLRAKIPRLYPPDSTVKVYGSSCNACYYLPTQTTKKLVMGQEYFIDVTAFNENGKGLPLANGPIRATPSQVPNAPSNVDLGVVSGKELEVFFSPPALASMNVNPNFNNDISSYIVQWDTKNDFKHGLPVCSACAVSLTTNALIVSQSLVTMLQVGTKFTIADGACVLEVAQVGGSRIDVVAGHRCDNFNSRAYALYYYTFPPAVLSGLQIQGSPPFRYLISGLAVSTKYFVRVAAVNSVPVQQIALDGNPPNNRKWSFPLSATTKDTVPDPPVSVFLSPFSGTSLEVQIQPPTRDGQGLNGAAITHFWVDVDTVSTFDSAAKAAPVDVPIGDAPLLYAGGPRVYYLKNLQTGVKYFVQVKAKNTIGYSRATLAPNPLAPTRNPDGPVNVKVSTVTTSPSPIDAATVVWQPPIANGGLPITSYRIEWWGAESRPEIQVIEIKWTTRPTTAPFKLAFGGGATGDMPFDVTPENVRSALMNIIVSGVQVVQHVEVSRATVNIAQGYQWRVTFLGALNAGNQPLIQFEFGTITGGSDVVGRVFEAQSGIAVPQALFPGKREVQVLMTSHTSTVGGYFRLSYRGSAWSNYLSATITAADLKLALEALPTVGKVTVAVQGASQNGLIWAITFESAVGNLPGLIVDGSKITPAGAFIGVKDGDNAVNKLGKLCVPGEDTCTGTWGTFSTGIAALATPGEAAVEYNFYETIDATALTYRITGLQSGKTYFVAVTAKNALGLGVRVRASPASIIPPVQVASPPTQVRVDVNPGVATQLTASWAAPTSSGGSDVRMYRVEYDPSPLFRNRGVEDFWCPTAPTYAVWRINTFRVGGSAAKPIANGYFNLALTRQNVVVKSEPIPWNAVAMASSEIGDPAPAKSKVFCTACASCTDTCPSVAAFPFQRRELSGSLQSKLEYLSTINSVQVVRSTTAGSDGGYAWTVTFRDVGDDFVLAVDTIALTCDDNTCGGGGVADYRVTTTKVTAGVANAPCTGTKVIPTTGALNKGQLYYVRVFAFNQIGFSLPALAPNPQKPMVVPGPPTGVTLQVLSVSDLKVLFSPPDDNGGDTVVEYLVEWSTNNAFTTVESGPVVLLTGGAPYYRVISGLTKGTFYFVRVKAKNSQGYGQYQISSPRSLNPYTTPSAPTKVTMGVTSLTMLTVQWNVPDDDGGDAISGYIVQWDISASFDSLGADATKTKITDVTQRSYTITLLTPGTVYYVRVFAVNAGGPGTAQITTPAALTPVNTRPGKPYSLQAAPTVNTGELLITWQAPRVPAHGIPCSGSLLVPLACPIYADLDVVFGGSSFDSYLVQYADSADFTGSNLVSTISTSALITGLDSGKLYFVRVLTQNVEAQKSDFCARANANGYLCPDNLVLLDGSIVTGAFVSATPK